MRNLILFILLLSLFGVFEASANELQKFETDYCTMFQDGTPSNPNAWKQCCFDHDLRFWFGGSEVQRDLADTRLKSCVEKTGHSFIARAMYYSVRAGRYSPVKNKYQWGWGWKPFEGYKSLTSEQKKLVKTKIQAMDLDPIYLKEFIAFYNL